MTAAVEVEHQLLLMLKSAHKLGYFNVLQWEKRFSLKRIHPIQMAPTVWNCSSIFSIHLPILALRNLCDSNKQAVGTNVEIQDLWDEPRSFTPKWNRLSLPKAVGVWLSRGRNTGHVEEQEMENSRTALVHCAAWQIVSHYGREADLVLAY